MKFFLFLLAVALGSGCTAIEKFDIKGNTSYATTNMAKMERIKHDLNIGYRHPIYEDDTKRFMIFAGGNAEFEHYNLMQDYSVNGYATTGIEF